MIAHVYYDGSIGEEHEIGDRVKTARTLYYGWNNPQEAIKIGTEGVVKWLDKYSKSSDYHTTFAAVDLVGYGVMKHLNSAFESLEKPRLVVKVIPE